MVLATHALVGAVIGKNIENIWIIALLSIIFHYVLDTIKHGEYVATMNDKNAFRNTSWKIALDFGSGLAIILSIIYFKDFDAATIKNIFIGMFFSMLPDGFTLVYWKTHWKLFEKLYKFHSWCHRLPRFSPERDWSFKNETYEIVIFLALTATLLFL